MKCLILTLLLLIVQTGSPVPRQTPHSLATDSSKNTQQGQKDEETSPLPRTVQKEKHAESAARDSGNETPKREQEHVIVERLPDKDKWDKTYIILSGVLVLVGILTFGAVIYQSIQTKRATVAMAVSTNLQKAALRQWVTIEKFSEAVEPSFTTTPPQMDLHFSFEIANRTKMPLTLEWYVISINQTKYSSRLNFTLAPDQVHGLKALINYTDEMRDKYLRAGFMVTVTGVVAYTDALNELQKQRFGYVRKCRIAGSETLNYEGSLPDEDIEKEQSKQ